MADKQMLDVIFIGGGLAAGLAAILLRQRMPHLNFLVIEAREDLTFPQTWSFQSLPHGIDPTLLKVFSEVESSWLNDFISKSWPCYEVRFPDLKKTLNIPYHSIRSTDFWTYLKRELGEHLLLGATVKDVTGTAVTLVNGASFTATQLIDTRGWADKAFPVAGYQKFIGLNLQLKKPHGLLHPILMDATVPQVDGFRFMYTLPWDERSLLIEDTHYSNTRDIDVALYRQAILDYAQTRGWDVESIGDMEHGALALPSFSKSRRFAPAPCQGVPQMGTRGGLFHATTGYSIYDAVLGAEQILHKAEQGWAQCSTELKSYGQKRWAGQEFYRRLNNMLFFAAIPGERYRILERFYAHDEDLISRFYAGKTNTSDKLRILSGKPPIAVRPALYHFFKRSEVQHG